MDRILTKNIACLSVFLTLSFMLPSDLAAARSVNISERLRLQTPRLDQKYEKLQTFLKAAEGAVSSLAAPRSGDKALICSVIVTGNEIKNGYQISTSGGEAKIFLSEDSVQLEKNSRIQGMLLSSMLLCRFGISPEGSFQKVPAWMTAALLNKIDRRRTAGLLVGITTYNGVRALCLSGNPPDLWRTVNFPLSPEDGPSFRLHSEVCALLMDGISKFPGNGRDLFSSILKSAADDVKDEMALRKVLEGAISKNGIENLIVPEGGEQDIVSDWFRMVARNGSISMFYPGTSDYAARRLAEIEKFECEIAPVETKPSAELQAKVQAEEQAAAKENPEKPVEKYRTYKIEELGEKWQEMKNPEKVLLSLQRKFCDLSNQLPSQFQDEMNGFLAAMKKLKEGRRDRFAGDYKDAKAKFAEELARLRELEDYMRAGESRHVPFGTSRSSELDFLEDSGSFAAKFWPALDSELSREENRFR